MEIGDRVYAPGTRCFGRIVRHGVTIGGVNCDFGIVSDEVNVMHGYNADELLPVEVTVFEGEFLKILDAVKKQLRTIEFGTHIRITVERVKENAQ